MLNEYRDQKKVKIIYQRNSGVSAARNLAASLGHSEWIAFLDSDDFWHPQKCQDFIDASIVHPGYSFFHCDEVWIKNLIPKALPKKFNKNSNLDPQDFFLRSLNHTIISTSTVMLRRSLFNQFNGFCTDLRICEDYDLWNKILFNQPIHFIDKTLVTKFGGASDQLSSLDPCLDLYRVKSLAQLLNIIPKHSIHFEKIKQTFEQKYNRLLYTLNKYQRLNDLEDINHLMSQFLF